MGKKGVVLFFVLAMLLVVVILANVVLNLITSHFKLSDHEVRRTQAFYAAQAGINYAYEQLRLGNASWLTTTNPKDVRICGNAFSALCSGPNDFVEPFFPAPINYVLITISSFDPINNNRTITAVVNYTFGGN